MKNKIIFFTIYLFLIGLGFLTIYLNLPSGQIIFTKTLIVNLFQRAFGLTIFTALFVQVILGMHMPRLTEKFGGWIFKVHVVNGILIYGLIVSHILSFVLFNYFIGKGLDPFYAFIDVCLMCKGKMEWFYNLGRIAFWLVTFGVIAGYFRTSSLFRVHWRKFHILNYFAFLVGGAHAYFIGTDILALPYSVFYYISMSVVLALTLKRFLGEFVGIIRLHKN